MFGHLNDENGHFAPSVYWRWFTHQQHQRRAADHCDGRGEFALVASTVGPCTAAGVLTQTQLLDAPLCHLQAGKRQGETLETPAVEELLKNMTKCHCQLNRRV